MEYVGAVGIEAAVGNGEAVEDEEATGWTLMFSLLSSSLGSGRRKPRDRKKLSENHLVNLLIKHPKFPGSDPTITKTVPLVFEKMVRVHDHNQVDNVRDAYVAKTNSLKRIRRDSSIFKLVSGFPKG